MKYWKQLCASIVLLLSIIWIWAGDRLPFRPFCIFHRVTGFPCPGCGGVRAAQALLSGDLLTALYINPLSVLLCIAVPVFIILYWIDYFQKTDRVKKILDKISRPVPTIIILVIIFINWMWNIYKGL